MKVGLPKGIGAKRKEATLLSEMYLSNLQNVFVQIVKWICQIVKYIWNFNEGGPAKENWCQKERGNFAVWIQ